MLNNKEPLERSWGLELRTEMNMHTNKYVYQQMKKVQKEETAGILSRKSLLALSENTGGPEGDTQQGCA